MARVESLSVLTQSGAKEFLAELYGAVIDNIENKLISSAIKNKNLSGTPGAGSVEAKRFVNRTSNPYGTARAANKGQVVKALPVTVPINIDRELITEVEQKDVSLYGVDNFLERQISMDEKSMARELERAFFAEAVAKGTVLTPAATEINLIVDQAIQQLTTAENDFVDGVPRDLIHITMSEAWYDKMRNFLDIKTNNANVGTDAKEFFMYHGVKIEPSTYLPAGTGLVAQVEESIAQPVLTSMSEPAKIQQSDAYSFGMFYYYGTTAVMPDLICIVEE